MTCICYSWVEVPFAEIGKCREGIEFWGVGRISSYFRHVEIFGRYISSGKLSMWSVLSKSVWAYSQVLLISELLAVI